MSIASAPGKGQALSLTAYLQLKVKDLPRFFLGMKGYNRKEGKEMLRFLENGDKTLREESGISKDTSRLPLEAVLLRTTMTDPQTGFSQIKRTSFGGEGCDRFFGLFLVCLNFVNEVAQGQNMQRANFIPKVKAKPRRDYTRAEDVARWYRTCLNA